jgi:hypothetical protein
MAALVAGRLRQQPSGCLAVLRAPGIEEIAAPLKLGGQGLVGLRHGRNPGGRWVSVHGESVKEAPL